MRATLTRVGAVSRKEFLHLGRDKRMLAMVVLMPILQLLLFAYAVSFDVEDVPTIVIDTDHTTTSQAYVAQYEASPFFDVVAHSDALSAADTAFDRGEAKVAVIIPAGFADALFRGERAEVAVLVDGSDPNSATVAQSYSVALNQLLSTQITEDWASRQGLDLSSVGVLEPRIRTWYNPDRSSADFLIPGLMVVILAILTTPQTAVSLVRERTLGTEEQLQISPMRRIELMVGKVAPWAVIAYIDVIAITLIGVLGFGIPLRGSVAALAVGAALFIVSALGMGLVVSAVTPSEDTANIAAMLISLLPAFLLSGFAFPLNQMPVIVQGFSYVFPARYMVTLSREVFLKGAGFTEVWPELVALTLTTVALIGLATILYGRRSSR